MAAALETASIGEEASTGCYLEEELDKDWRAFHETLDAFPHSFQLEDVEQLSKATCSKLLNALKTELDYGLSTPLETAWALNLLCFFRFKLEHSREALCLIEEALSQPGEERNLVSLGNRAAILWQIGDRSKAKEQATALGKLKEDPDFTYFTVRAKAELAFSYSRIGGQFSSKAVPLFTKAIAKARAPEIWSWKFGLALTQRRRFHMNNVPILANTRQEETLLLVLDTLQEVVNNSECNNLKAKSYSEIAFLLQDKRGSKSQEAFEKKAGMTAVEACEKALELDANDPSVLWKCGRIFRYAKRLDESLQLLLKSVELRPTTTEYHHLGLTLRSLARRAKDDVYERGRGGSRPGRGGVRGGWRNREERLGGADTGACGGGRDRRDFMTEGRQHRETDNNVSGQKTQGWNANQDRQGQEDTWQFVPSSKGRRNRNGCRRGGLDTREDRYNSATNRPEVHFTSYSQLCSSGGQGRDRVRVNPNTAERSVQQAVATNERATEHNANTRAAYNVSETEFNTSGPAACPQVAPDRGVQMTSQREIRSFRQVVKSPGKQGDHFERTDEFVQQALDAFQKAIELSEADNLQAVYDLALMYKALDEFDEALRLLNIILLPSCNTVQPFYKINAFEQAGLILKEKSQMESDLGMRKRLDEEGESKLNMALRLCSRLCNKLPGLQDYIQHVWLSFPTLFQAAERSDRNKTDKLLEQARLFNMIKDHHQSMALLQEISMIDPESAKSSDYLKMCIENHVELEQYDQALTFLELLTCTAQRSTMEHFEDVQYIQKVYMKAGRAALLSGHTQDALRNAKYYFSAAFADTFRERQDDTSSSDDTQSLDERWEDDSWDIMLLHEKSADPKSVALADIFERAFGLKVTGMFEDCLPGTFRQDSFNWVMKRSKLVVVLAGGRHLSPSLRPLVHKAVKRPSTVALLVDGSHVPEAIRSMAGPRSRCPLTRHSVRVNTRQTHHMVCPEKLLREDTKQIEGAAAGDFPLDLVEKACEVFSFLVDIPIH